MYDCKGGVHHAAAPLRRRLALRASSSAALIFSVFLIADEVETEAPAGFTVEVGFFCIAEIRDTPVADGCTVLIMPSEPCETALEADKAGLARPSELDVLGGARPLFSLARSSGARFVSAACRLGLCGPMVPAPAAFPTVEDAASNPSRVALVPEKVFGRSLVSDAPAVTERPRAPGVAPSFPVTAVGWRAGVAPGPEVTRRMVAFCVAASEGGLACGFELEFRRSGGLSAASERRNNFAVMSLNASDSSLTGVGCEPAVVPVLSPAGFAAESRGLLNPCCMPTVQSASSSSPSLPPAPD